MLSISFDRDREWWVSGTVFDRLYDAAIANSTMPSDLIVWRHIADANGGLSVHRQPPTDAQRFTSALRDTARLELHTAAESPENETYRVSLENLLRMLEPPRAE